MKHRVRHYQNVPAKSVNICFRVQPLTLSELVKTVKVFQCVRGFSQIYSLTHFLTKGRPNRRCGWYRLHGAVRGAETTWEYCAALRDGLLLLLFLICLFVLSDLSGF